MDFRGRERPGRSRRMLQDIPLTKCARPATTKFRCIRNMVSTCRPTSQVGVAEAGLQRRRIRVVGLRDAGGGRHSKELPRYPRAGGSGTQGRLEVSARNDALQPAGRDQALDVSDGFRSDFGRTAMLCSTL